MLNQFKLCTTWTGTFMLYAIILAFVAYTSHFTYSAFKYQSDWAVVSCESPSNLAKCWNMQGQVAKVNLRQLRDQVVNLKVVSYTMPLDRRSELAYSCKLLNCTVNLLSY